MEEKSFYYSFKKWNAWTVSNIFLCTFMAAMLWCCPCLLCCSIEALFLTVLFLVSLAGWAYKYLFRHRAITVNDDFIIIDHNAPLYWKDVAKAEERLVSCCCKKMKVIVLVAKEGIDYKYNWLQKHNGDFTPFAIPLYGILTPEDEKAISDIVAAKVGLQKLPE